MVACYEIENGGHIAINPMGALSNKGHMYDNIELTVSICSQHLQTQFTRVRIHNTLFFCVTYERLQ